MFKISKNRINYILIRSIIDNVLKNFVSILIYTYIIYLYVSIMYMYMYIYLWGKQNSLIYLSSFHCK